MSKFNTAAPKVSRKTINIAGGEAFTMSKKLELVTTVLSSLLKDEFYASGNVTIDRIKALVSEIKDPTFVAKLAVYARHEHGLRSVSHLLASLVAASSFEDKRKFFAAVVRRPDDITEILSCYLHNNKKIANAMRRGLADAFDKFNAYSLSKYRMENKNIKLVDAVNLLHPTPTEQNAGALAELVNGTLASTETWEAQLSAVGQTSMSDEEKRHAKRQIWKDLITNRKLGYMALIRNLRNIHEVADEELIDLTCNALQDKVAIKKSLILPFRFETAYTAIEGLRNRKLDAALNKAIDLALDNVPAFDGKTLVVVDSSGSMGNVWFKAALFAAALVKKNNCDLMTFDFEARYHTRNLTGSLLDIAKSLPFSGGGTDFTQIFKTIGPDRYDRIILLSDMQGWMQNGTSQLFNKYKSLRDIDTKLYSFDLAGYGTLMFPQNSVYCLAGLSDKVFDTIRILEHDRNALINTIDNYPWA